MHNIVYYNFSFDVVLKYTVSYFYFSFKFFLINLIYGTNLPQNVKAIIVLKNCYSLLDIEQNDEFTYWF